MANLRSLIDGVGSLQINADPEAPSNDLRISQDVVIRRQTNRSGPTTSEVLVGRILAMDGDIATVSIQKGNVTERRTVSVNDLQPVTQQVKQQLNQYSPAFRRGA